MPYLTREEAERHPEKLRKLRSIRFQTAPEGLQTVRGYLDGDLNRRGRLETTVELQALVDHSQGGYPKRIAVGLDQQRLFREDRARTQAAGR